MVIGLDTFAAHFAAYQEHYVLIGGAAAWLILDEAGIDPRTASNYPGQSAGIWLNF